jgi:serine protease AprX
MAEDSGGKKRKKNTGKAGEPEAVPPANTSEERREEVVEQAEELKRTQLSRPAEIRLGMMRSVITEPLLSQVLDAMAANNSKKRFDVIIALNELYKGGVPAALKAVEQQAIKWGVPYTTVSHYCAACLTAEQIVQIAEATRKQIDEGGRNAAVVYRIWEDNDISVTLTRSLMTVKADAAQRAFHADGDGITWAVLDSGIQGSHPHFTRKEPPFGPFQTLEIPDPVNHMDFTPAGRAEDGKPAVGNQTLVDRLGHGTHVAGVIAGYWTSQNPDGDYVAGSELRSESSKNPLRKREKVKTISGVAPRCKLVSMKVIADKTETDPNKKQTAGQGKVSWVLMAIEEIQKLNQFGKRLLIHGANMSLGYDFDPRWFACGQSPICVEVNRLVKSGVSVVVSAGNSGYSTFINADDVPQATFSDLSISDPGNSELAVTVGSTHKEMPHTYGVSYFSSRGPTGDGRLKPDLIAPGERIVSCAAGAEKDKYPGAVVDDNGQEQNMELLYVEQSGTSMAAPHVSGAIAAFLSVRPEFLGQPEKVKELFMANTIDLRRDRCFQGTGLLDLMKVLQAV